MTLLNLAQLEIDAEAFEQARAHLDRALVLSKAAYGSHHSNTARVLIGVGRLGLATEDLDAALVAYEAARDALEREKGRDDPAVADALAGVADVLDAMGRESEAVASRARAEAIRAPR